MINLCLASQRIFANQTASDTQGTEEPPAVQGNFRTNRLDADLLEFCSFFALGSRQVTRRGKPQVPRFVIVRRNNSLVPYQLRFVIQYTNCLSPEVPNKEM